MSRGKMLIGILAGVMVVASLIGGIGLAKLTTPVVKFTNQIEEGDYEGAQTAYQEKIVVNEDYSEDANEEVSKHLGAALSDYMAGLITYEAISAQVDMIKDVMTEMDMTEIEGKVQKAKASKDGYEAGLKALKKKNFTKAYESFSEVISEDNNYADAQSKIGEIPAQYEKYVLKTGKKYQKSKNVIKAYELYYDAGHAEFMGKNKKITQAVKKLKKSYEKQQVNRQKKLVKTKKYQKAVKECSELLQDKMKGNGKLKKIKKLAEKKLKEKNKKASQKKKKAKNKKSGNKKNSKKNTKKSGKQTKKSKKKK